MCCMLMSRGQITLSVFSYKRHEFVFRFPSYFKSREDFSSYHPTKRNDLNGRLTRNLITDGLLLEEKC